LCLCVQAAGALKNLASDDDNKDHICNEAVIAALVNALYHSTPQVALEITQTISNLAAKHESRVIISQQQVVDQLLNLAKHDYNPLRESAAAALQHVKVEWA
jgi:hypothetical protein